MFMDSAEKRFRAYKTLAEKAMAQLEEKDLYFSDHEDTNSIALIIQHLAENMLSRWTNFLETDGEKEWRHRDTEFELHLNTKDKLMETWEKGWTCLFDTLHSLTDEDLSKTVYIRKEPLSVMDAIHRQLAHYAYHIGQIVYVAKMIQKENWQSLSIPKKK